MKINLEHGVFIQIAGTVGQYNTLPIDILVRLMENMQSLLQNLALSRLSGRESIDLNQFKVELCDFREGSGAVPKVKFTPRYQQQSVAADFAKQRAIVTTEFETLLGVAADPRKLGEYLRVRFKDIERRNSLINLYHAFTNAAGNSPMAIVAFEMDDKIEPIFPIRRMTIGQRDALLVNVKPIDPITEHEMFFRKIQITKVNGKITGKSKILAEYMVNAATEISYSFPTLTHEGRTYELYDLFHCKVDRDEEGGYVIKSEMLDIAGIGETEDAAASRFEEAFDALYRRCEEQTDDALNDEKQLRIRQMLPLLVKEVR